MEDRITPGVYLEMTDRPAAGYGSSRAPEVLAVPGASRATWWRNAHPFRDDLPRRLPEFDVLGLFEVDDGFVPPDVPDDVTGYHYRHHARPAQGRLTGGPTVGLLLVLISPRRPEDAQALRDWGDFVHIRHIAEVAVPGYSMITPYEHADAGEPRYLHLYEIDDDDPEAAFRAMTPRVSDMLGPPGTPLYDHWATHPALRIDYVNTFRLTGEAWPS